MALNRGMANDIIHLHNGLLFNCIRNNNIRKFEGKYIELEKKFNLSEKNQTQDEKHGKYS